MSKLVHAAPGRSRRAGLPIALALCASLSAPACAPKLSGDLFERERTEREQQYQQDEALAGSLARRYRAFEVGEPVLIAAGQVCARTVPSLGAQLASVDDFKPAQRAYVRTTLRLSEFVRVFQVVDGLGADTARLRQGDIVRGVNGVHPRSGAHALSLLNLSGPNRLRVHRDRREREIQVESQAKCDYPLLLPPDRRVNAFSDGTNIIVTSALMELLANDDELATAIAHEAAHNVLEHAKAREQNVQIGAQLGAILGIAADVAARYHLESMGVDTSELDPELAAELTAQLGAQLGAYVGAHVGGLVFSKRFELEADAIGLYLVALAGFDIDAGASWLRTLAARDPAIVSPGLTHPDLAQREEALALTADLIRSKMAAGRLAAPIRAPVVHAEPTLAELRSDLPAAALEIAERRGLLLGRATTCRVPAGSVDAFDLSSRSQLRKATYGREQADKAIAVFEGAIERGAETPGLDCHATVVEFYEELGRS